MTAPNWNLESILPGGLVGEPYRAVVKALRDELDALVQQTSALPPLPEGMEQFSDSLQALYAIAGRTGPVSLLAHCYTCDNTRDRGAQNESSTVRALWSRYRLAWIPLSDQLAHCSEAALEALLERPELAVMRPTLERIRSQAPLMLPRAEQALVTQLSRDSIHAWSDHYNRVSGRLVVSLADGRELSVGRAKNLLGGPDASERTMALEGLDAAWGTVAEDCAVALTHIVGTRMTLNTRRGVDELADSLSNNRMRRESLEAMLEAARRAGPLLTRYLDIKARLLGKEKVGFEDLSAPVGTVSEMSWDAAEAFIQTHFHSHHPELAALAQRAFSERWIEAEDRDHKRQGAWCGRVGDRSGASRIFMTFGETFRSTTTLAHELGHAFHNWVLRDAHPAQNRAPSTLAETASIFAENIIRDAALAAAQDRSSRLAMLDMRLAAGASFLMNLPFRFYLEQDLYAARAEGLLDPDWLSERTVHWQKVCYRDHLSSWYPHFWAEKLHFYMSSQAFYNYPYTYGYLFSSLVYQRALAEGAGYHTKYVALLQQTGWQDAEPLAAEQLGIDLTSPDDWYGGIAPLEADLAAFEQAAGD
jgi:pepF/M3 family oligoendopeptidase